MNVKRWCHNYKHANWQKLTDMKREQTKTNGYLRCRYTLRNICNTCHLHLIGRADKSGNILFPIDYWDFRILDHCSFPCTILNQSLASAKKFPFLLRQSSSMSQLVTSSIFSKIRKANYHAQRWIIVKNSPLRGDKQISIFGTSRSASRSAFSGFEKKVLSALL